MGIITANVRLVGSARIRVTSRRDGLGWGSTSSSYEGVGEPARAADLKVERHKSWLQASRWLCYSIEEMKKCGAAKGELQPWIN